MADKAADTASGFFLRDFNCAQAVLAAFGPRFGLSSELALRVAAAFGSGVARQGRDCGAVQGALMVIGLARASAGGSLESKLKVYEQALEFVAAFKRRHGTVVCRELVGYDLSDPAQLKDARERMVFVKVCLPLVRDAAEILEEMLPHK